MSLQTSSQEKPFANFLTALRDTPPSTLMGDIAVLFTDVVGSTRYFKAYGDIKGREMLRRHHAIAISIVEEYGGSLIKEVGDSVMVYFPDACNALKAAVKMQHKFHIINKDADSTNEIHIRVGLHFGKVIIEEKDIYGDVVNVAAKLTNLANGDQIFISQEVYDLTKALPSLNFELINFWNMKSVPTGLTIYKVAWERASISEPDCRSILSLRPVDYHADANGHSRDGLLWERFISVKDHFFQGLHESEKTLSDHTILLTYGDAFTAFGVAERVLDYLNTERKTTSDGATPGMYLAIAHDINSKGCSLVPDLAGIAPGDIWITKEVYRDIKKRREINVSPSPENNLNRPFYRLVGDESRKPAQQSAFRSTPSVGVTYGPCFYCGLQSHYPKDCPSKTLSESSNALTELGYLSPAKIRALLDWYTVEANVSSAMPGAADTKNLPPSADGSSPTAITSGDAGVTRGLELITNAIYESRSIYQLRFFRTIWSSYDDEWEKAKKAKSENEGGFAWLALDSLRVSNHDKAEAFLKTALDKDSKDFKAICVAGFLSIERNDLQAARDDFERALPLARKAPHKIFVCFLQSRIYGLLGDTQRASERIRKALSLDAVCHEALYQDTVFKLQQSEDKFALQRLVKLVTHTRNYYPLAFVDPEMRPYTGLLEAELTRLFEEARADALHYAEDARITYSNTQATLTKEMEEEVCLHLSSIDALTATESYFGYLDVPKCADKVITVCNSALREQKRELSETIYILNKHLEKDIAFARSYRFPHFSSGPLQKLQFLKSRLSEIGRTNDLFSSWQFDACRKECSEIARSLRSLEIRLSKLRLVGQAASLFFGFMKRSSQFFSIIFFLGVFVFPLISDQITGILTSLDISSTTDLWSLQKTFLIAGGIVSLIASLILSLRNAGSEKPPSTRNTR